MPISPRTPGREPIDPDEVRGILAGYERHPHSYEGLEAEVERLRELLGKACDSLAYWIPYADAYEPGSDNLAALVGYLRVSGGLTVPAGGDSDVD